MGRQILYHCATWESCVYVCVCVCVCVCVYVRMCGVFNAVLSYAKICAIATMIKIQNCSITAKGLSQAHPITHSILSIVPNL